MIRLLVGGLFRLFSRIVFVTVLDLAVRVSIPVLRPVPTGPFLALSPAQTPIGRSLTVAPLLAGLLGMTVLVSLSIGTWILWPAIIFLAIVGIGCSRAYATLWWPAVLGVCLWLGLYGFTYLHRLSPWAVRLEAGSPPALAFIYGAGVIFLASLWSSAVTVIATSEP